MESKKRNVIIDRIITVVTKVVEIVHWIGTVCMIILAFMPLFAWDKLSDQLNRTFLEEGEILALNVYGFEVNFANTDGTPNVTLFILFAVTAAITLSLFAMVFRNIHIIFKKMGSSDNSPFCPDIVRMIREIGIFQILSCVFSFVMSVVIQIVCTFNSIECECVYSSTGILIGLIVICLSRVFSYGVSLQKDVDGLL